MSKFTNSNYNSMNVSKVVGIAKTGNNVFNAQIVRIGPMTTRITASNNSATTLPILFLLKDSFIQIFKLFMLSNFL